MCGAARRRVLLADHSKIGHISMLKYADLSDVDLLITDDGADDRDLKKISDAGLPVHRV